MSTPNLDLIFERWKAILSTRSRKRDDTPGNFDELFEQLYNAGATLDQARSICTDAIKAHSPNSVTAKYIWNKARCDPKFNGVTYNEFVTDWHKDIADKAANSMYTFFPIPADTNDDGEPKILGDNKMSVKEYKLLRNHANQFRPVDLKSLNATDSDLLSEEELLNLVRKNENG
jgi:hypothetical protein